MDTTSDAYPCPVDNRPCEVIALLSSPDPAALPLVRDCLPCDRCRKAEADATRLPRLGKHERRVLLAAPGPDAEWAVIGPPEEGRAADEAHRRALRRLHAAGLLALDWELARQRADGERRRCRAVRLSPLGAALVGRVRPALATGRRVRWNQYRAALVAACRVPAPELLPLFLAAVREKRKEASDFAGFAARQVHAEPHRRDVRACDAVLKAAPPG